LQSAAERGRKKPAGDDGYRAHGSLGFSLMRPLRWLALSLVALACSPATPPARLPVAEPLVLPGSDGVTHDLRAEVARARLTVFVFYSRACPCLRVHEARLHELADAYRPRGVAVLLVDSEVGAEPAVDALEARKRGYRVPLLTDRGARLAKAV